MDKQKSQDKLTRASFINVEEGLSFSDYFDDSVPYEQKPPEMIRPMQEDDYPIQTKSQEAGLWEFQDLSRTIHDQLWLDTDGEFHETSDHARWIRNWFAQHGIAIADNETAYMAAFKRGFIRVWIGRSARKLHFQYGDRGTVMTKPNHKQMSALKNAAIENGWVLYDDLRNNEIDLYEGSLMMEDVVKNTYDYWLDSNGKFHRSPFGHIQWARNFLLTKQYKFDPDSESTDLYDIMFSLKWIRVKVRDDKIYFEYGDTPPSNIQVRQLRDTAIESQMKLIDAKGQYKELDLLQENYESIDFNIEESSYWMNPHGKWIEVGYEGHVPFAAQFLSQNGVKVDSNGYYDAMYRLGWVRLYNSGDTIHVAHSKSREPNNAQWRSIRDASAEYNLDIWDDTTNRAVELEEGIGGRTLFIESMMPNDMETFKSHLTQLFAYLKEELQLKTIPKVKLVADEKNANKVLGKTAYYDPEKQLVVLYTTNRHQKDILRSFAHEVIHHWQHENEKLQSNEAKEKGANDPQYAQKNPWLRQMEKQAYLLGNICFRDWEDQKKAKDRASQKKMVEMTPLIRNGHKPSHPYRKYVEKPAPHPDSIEEKTMLIGKQYPPKRPDYSG